MKVFASLGARSVAFFIDAFLLCVVWVSLVTFSGEQGFPLTWWSFIALTAIYFTAPDDGPPQPHFPQLNPTIDSSSRGSAMMKSVTLSRMTM